MSSFYELVRKEQTTAPMIVVSLSYPAGGASHGTSHLVKTAFVVPLVDVGDQCMPVRYMYHGRSGFSGAFDWIPEFDPLQTDNHYGVNRARDPMRLAGIRVNTCGLSFEEATKFAWKEVFQNGGMARHFFVNPKWAKAPYDVRLEAGSTEIKIRVEPDETCPDDCGLMTQFDTWVLFLDEERRVSALVCEAPGYNARVQLI